MQNRVNCNGKGTYWKLAEISREVNGISKESLVIRIQLTWRGAGGIDELGLYERGVSRSVGGVGGVKNGRLFESTPR